jgi:holo-[acyl-carrier protein] synthase
VILGIGNDLVDIRRIARSIERFGDRFIDRIYTPAERVVADRRAGGPDSRNNRAAAYAKRFAAKEACAKALGTGFDHGVFWRDIGVVNSPKGRPFLELTGGALDRLRAMTPDGLTARLHLTLTDEFPMAQAVVVISAESPAAARPFSTATPS